MSIEAQHRAAVSVTPPPLWVIVLSAAAVAGIGMGLRQVMGLYMDPMTKSLGVGYESFSLAIAIANLVWGMAAPFTGLVSDKYGTGRVIVFGAINTALGLFIMYLATSEVHLFISGFFLGLGVAGAGVNATVGAVGRAAPPESRTAAIAAIGMGSGIGILIALPYTHLLIQGLTWHPSLLVLTVTALFILPLAIPLSGKPQANANAGNTQTLAQALAESARHPSFWMLNAGFFVCGFHVVFYGTHLPAYVKSQGLAPEIGVISLVVVGVGNLVGTYIAGQWGRTKPKRIGLALIYLGRAFVFLGFLFLPITGPTVVILSALLGLLWLSTIPLTSGLVATFYGPKWMTMLYGIVFFSHQIGSALGVWLGGVIFDKFQSYDAMWWISVALGIFAALVHWPIVERPVDRAAVPAPARV